MKKIVVTTDEEFKKIRVNNNPEDFFNATRARIEKICEQEVDLSSCKIYIKEILDKRIKNMFIASFKSRSVDFLTKTLRVIERMEDEQNNKLYNP